MRKIIDLITELQQMDVEKILSDGGGFDGSGNGNGRGKGPWEDDPDDGSDDGPEEPLYDNHYDFSVLDEFVKSYIEAMLWTEEDTVAEYGWKCYFSSILAESIPDIISDCAKFRSAAGDLLHDLNLSQAGHDFWLTRNRHGAGFWDRGLRDVGDKLTNLSHKIGEIDISVRPTDGAIVYGG